MLCGASQNLEQINDHLKNSGTPYLGGERPNARDLDLGPKFYHIKTAMKHYKVRACSHRSYCTAFSSWLHLLLCVSQSNCTSSGESP